MTEEPETSDLQNLWQAQPEEISPMLLADVHQRALKYESRMKWMMGLRYGETIVALAIIGMGLFYVPDGLIRIGLFMMTLGIMFSLHVSHANRLKFRNAEAVSTASRACFDVYKQGLERRIQYISTAWAWYILPMMPGLVLILYRLHQRLVLIQPHPHARVSKGLATAILYGDEIFAVVFLAGYIFYLHLRAQKLRRELAELGD